MLRIPIRQSLAAETGANLPEICVMYVVAEANPNRRGRRHFATECSGGSDIQCFLKCLFSAELIAGR